MLLKAILQGLYQKLMPPRRITRPNRNATWSVQIDDEKLRQFVMAQPDVDSEDVRDPTLYALTVLNRDYGIQVRLTTQQD